MKHLKHIALLAVVAGIIITTQRAQAGFSISVDALEPNTPISSSQALCVPTADGKSDKVSAAMRPAIRWADAPKGTKSFALFMMDPDVPADFTNAGKVGKVIAADAKRQDFYHWGVVDIAADVNIINGGLAKLPLNAGRALPNDLGAAGYVPHAAEYGGPCPPWNDARIHNYHFIILALDETPPAADAKETAKAAFNRLITSPHVLGKAAVVGTYTLNQELRTEGK